METPKYTAGLRIVGGHPALDLANTVDGRPDGRPGRDYLEDYAHLVAWGEQVGVVSGGRARRLLREAEGRPDEAAAAHGKALELRGVVQGVFGAVASGQDPPRASLDVLGRYAARALARGALVREEGVYRWGWSETGDLGIVTWPVAHAAAGLVTSKRLDRVKRCAACWWLFVDASKNRSRRWCTMEDCGTAEKMRRYVVRRAARRRAT